MDRGEANQQAFERLTAADPFLVGVAKAGDAVPGMTPTTILTSGAPLPWIDYHGLQRQAILYAAIYEGLAGSVEEAAEKIERGDITVDSTQSHGCAGVHAGVYTASMPVLVVEERTGGRRGFCQFFEGDSPRRLGFGFYGDDVVAQLRFVDEVLAPTIGAALRRTGPIALGPIAARALQLGDEMHARTIAGTMIFVRGMFGALCELSAERPDDVKRVLAFLDKADHFFYRVWMAACKAMLDGANDIPGSSVVTAMVFNCKDFAIRISGLGDTWFRGPHQTFDGRYIAGKWKVPHGVFSTGSDCLFSECVGLGAFASAASFPLQGYQGVPPSTMVERNLAMYDITVGEHPDFRIPFLDNRGVPVAIDALKVVATGTLPMFQGILVNDAGNVVGTAVARPPMECFQAAAAAYAARYGPAYSDTGGQGR